MDGHELLKTVLFMFFLGATTLMFGLVYISCRIDVLMTKIENLSNRIGNLEMQKFVKAAKKRGDLENGKTNSP